MDELIKKIKASQNHTEFSIEEQKKKYQSLKTIFSIKIDSDEIFFKTEEQLIEYIREKEIQNYEDKLNIYSYYDEFADFKGVIEILRNNKQLFITMNESFAIAYDAEGSIKFGYYKWEDLYFSDAVSLNRLYGKFENIGVTISNEGYQQDNAHFESLITTILENIEFGNIEGINVAEISKFLRLTDVNYNRDELMESLKHCSYKGTGILLSDLTEAEFYNEHIYNIFALVNDGKYQEAKWYYDEGKDEVFEVDSPFNETEKRKHFDIGMVK